MMNKKLWLLLFSAALCGCSDNHTQKDMERPVIVDIENGSPFACQTILRGDTLPVRCLFTDNKELGAFNIEIHHNFDHHSHSTSAAECPFSPDKEPENPWIYNKDMDIPENSLSYSLDIKIPIPNNVDTGDYHFAIRLTDKAGWQEFKAVSLKMR